MNKVLIIEHEETISKFFKIVIEKILLDSEVFVLNLEEAAKTLKETNDFVAIVVNGEASFNVVPKEQRKNVIIHARSSGFIQKSIINAEANIILWSSDFYDGMFRFFSLKNLV